MRNTECFALSCVLLFLFSEVRPAKPPPLIQPGLHTQLTWFFPLFRSQTFAELGPSASSAARFLRRRRRRRRLRARRFRPLLAQQRCRSTKKGKTMFREVAANGREV